MWKLDSYPKSAHTLGDTTVCVARGEMRDAFFITGANPGFADVLPYANGLIAPITRENMRTLRALFPFAAPGPVLTRERTIGLGDRLGLATPGQLRAVARTDCTPVLAQQSIRELTLTSRTFADVLDSASIAVFREDFRRGWGADGDHLKTAQEVEDAIRAGYTMITLDLSETIHGEAASLSQQDAQACALDPTLADAYLDKTFELEGHAITFSKAELVRAWKIYGDALDFAGRIYHEIIQTAPNPPDFEMSIDETAKPTSPAEHYFVASELARREIRCATVAPRFCGEFQKGIDYIGDLDQFRREAAVHAAIARRFGYKLSIHSGSDKFSVFETIGRETRGRFHVKTAGTNWLEAMRIVALCDPALYRAVHAFALGAFDEATKYYHVTTNLANIPPLSTLADAQLPSLFDQNDARQLIHITYGLILTAKDESGRARFADRLFACWRAHDEQYAQALDRHITKHLQCLYAGI